jgi:hypothetical protein
VDTVRIVCFSSAKRLNVYADTAYIASRGGWMLCDDQSVKLADPRHVVVSKLSAQIYILADSNDPRAKKHTCYFTRELKHKLHH